MDSPQTNILEEVNISDEKVKQLDQESYRKRIVTPKEKKIKEKLPKKNDDIELLKSILEEQTKTIASLKSSIEEINKKEPVTLSTMLGIERAPFSNPITEKTPPIQTLEEQKPQLPQWKHFRRR